MSEEKNHRFNADFYNLDYYKAVVLFRPALFAIVIIIAAKLHADRLHPTPANVLAHLFTTQSLLWIFLLTPATFHSTQKHV